MSPPVSEAADLRAALDALAQEVESVQFAVPGPNQDRRSRLRDGIAWSIHEYLLPRLADIEGPARVVVVGSTGSGKSTIVNSIAGYRVTEPGALRPTTRLPVLWCHQKHEAEFAFDFLTGYGTASDAERPMKIVAGLDPLLEAICVLDAPDFDSVELTNQQIAEELLAIADVCIFVTSAQRYADAVPWGFLEKAQHRGIPVIHVMNRMPPGGSAAADDYRSRLRERSIPVNLFVTIDEQRVDPDHGGLPPETVARIVERLQVLSDPEERRRLLVATTRAAITDIMVRLDGLIEEVRAERGQLDALSDVARLSYERQVDEIAQDIERGSLIRAHVVERWQEFLGTGELMKGLVEGASRVRDWLGRLLGMGAPVERIEGEVRGELETIVSRRAGRAAAATAAAWELEPVGSGLLAGAGYSLWHEDPATPDRAAAAVDDWMADVARLVERQGGDKRRLAQIASAGVNAVAVAATVTVFVHTGGVTGTEIGVAAGAAAVQQKILEHLFGSAAARSLISDAKQALAAAMSGVLAQDRARFDAVLAGLFPAEGQEERVAAAGHRVITQGEAFYAE